MPTVVVKAGTEIEEKVTGYLVSLALSVHYFSFRAWFYFILGQPTEALERSN